MSYIIHRKAECSLMLSCYWSHGVPLEDSGVDSDMTDMAEASAIAGQVNKPATATPLITYCIALSHSWSSKTCART